MNDVMTMSISEIQTTYLNLFPCANEEYMNNVSIRQLACEIEEEEARISDIIFTEEVLTGLKHSPSKKKKANRVRKNKKVSYVKPKSKWKIPLNKPISDNTTNNRPYLKKMSAGYLKLKPQKSL